MAPQSVHLRVSGVATYVDLFCIPLVKRAVSTLFRLGWVVIAIGAVLSKPCGGVRWIHYTLIAWVAAAGLAEAHAASVDVAHYARDKWNRLDIIAIVGLALALFFRFCLLEASGVGLLSAGLAGSAEHSGPDRMRLVGVMPLLGQRLLSQRLG